MFLGVTRWSSAHCASSFSAPPYIQWLIWHLNPRCLIRSPCHGGKPCQAASRTVALGGRYGSPPFVVSNTRAMNASKKKDLELEMLMEEEELEHEGVK
jgi:hypothetical protein